MAILNIGFDKTFLTIMEAYNASNTGDILLIDEGIYKESIVTSDNKCVHLVGNTKSPGEDKVMIVSPVDEFTLYINGLIDECVMFVENITFKHIFSGDAYYSNTLANFNNSNGCTIIFNRCHLDAGNEQPILFFSFEDRPVPITFNNCRLTFKEDVEFINTLGQYHFVWAGRNTDLYFNKCIVSAQLGWLARCAVPIVYDYVINKEVSGYGPGYGITNLLPIRYYFKGKITDDISAGIKVPGATLSWTDKAPEINLSPNKLIATLSKDYDAYSYLVRSSVGKTFGKWYWEVIMFSGQRLTRCGVATENAGKFLGLGSDVHGWGYSPSASRMDFMYSAFITGNHRIMDDYYALCSNNGDVIGIALDLDNGRLWYSVNGEWLFDGDPSIGQNPIFEGVFGKIFPAASLYSMYSLDASIEFIFDPSDLTYNIPEGFSFYSTEMLWKVKCINAVTNEVEGYTISDPVNKEYYLETTYSGEHFVICEDAAEMPDFNNVLLGRLTPKELN